MEDVKELLMIMIKLNQFISFNPCFNGRCKRTALLIKTARYTISVSILVLMEDVKEL